MSWLAPVTTRPTGALDLDGVACPIASRRVSAISLLAVATEQASRDLGVSFGFRVLGDGRAVVFSEAAFSIGISGDIATALGFPGAFTGVGEYTGTDPVPGAVVPRGLRLSGPLWATSAPGVSEASAVAPAAGREGVTGTLLLDVTWAEAFAIELALRGQVVDVAHGGRWAGRGRVTSVVRRRQGRAPGVVVVELALEGVS